MLYYYKIGYYGYEESDYIELLHKEKFNKKEFEDMFVKSVLELLLNKRDSCNLILAEEGKIPDFMMEGLKKKYKKFMTPAENFDEYVKQQVNRHSYYKYHSDFMGIYESVAKIMVEKYGFEKIQYKQRISLDGFAHLVEKNKDSDIQKEEKKIFNRIFKGYWGRKKKEI